MSKKSSTVLHFKIKPSDTLYYGIAVLYLCAWLLLFFSSLEGYFKVLLTLLLILEYKRQQQILRRKNSLKAIEARGDKLFLRRKHDASWQTVSGVKIRQNRISAEIELQLNDTIHREFLYHDCFSSKVQFNVLMQHLRFYYL